MVPRKGCYGWSAGSLEVGDSVLLLPLKFHQSYINCTLANIGKTSTKAQSDCKTVRIVKNVVSMQAFYLCLTTDELSVSPCQSVTVRLFQFSLLPVDPLRPAVYLTAHISSSPLLSHPPIPRGVLDGPLLLSRPPSCVRLQKEGGDCIYQALACLRAALGSVELNWRSEESSVGTSKLGWCVCVCVSRAVNAWDSRRFN